MKRPIRRGVSLVELMIALFIFGLILAPLFNAYVQSSTIIKIGQHDLEVLNLGSSFASQIRARDLASMTITTSDILLSPCPGGGAISFGNPAIEIEMPAWDSTMFSLSLSTKNVSLPGGWLGPPPIARLCSLKVMWKERLGQTRTMVFPVLFTKE